MTLATLKCSDFHCYYYSLFIFLFFLFIYFLSVVSEFGQRVLERWLLLWQFGSCVFALCLVACMRALCCIHVAITLLVIVDVVAYERHYLFFVFFFVATEPL